jgi:DNA-binding GntR family transcriptional regulator
MSESTLEVRGSTGGAARRPTGQRLAAVVYDDIKEQLLDGTFRKGNWLEVERLRAEFQVSKQPVMDALRRLAAEGLVEIIPQVGCRVPSYSIPEILDFFTVFGAVEATVAAMAAQRVTDQQLVSLGAVNKEIRSLLKVKDPAYRSHAYRTLNRQFHAVVATYVDTNVSSRLWDMSDLIINTAGVERPLATAIRARYEDHEQVIEAISAKDSEAAHASMHAHILATVSIIDAEGGFKTQ